MTHPEAMTTSPDPSTLTERQKLVLLFIEGHIRQHGFPPTIREIGRHLGIKSTNGVNDHLNALQKKGFLTREEGKSRTLQLTVVDGEDDSANDDLDDRLPGLRRAHDDDDFVDVPLLGRVAGADGLKTGHTEEAGYGFTGSAMQDGRRLVIVIAGLTSFNERIAQSVAFMDWGFRAWTQQVIAPAGKVIDRAPVWMGSAATVGLMGPINLKVTVPRGFGGQRTVKIVYDGPIAAPIKRGQPIASMVVSVPGMPATRIPLVAAEAVEAAGFFGRVGTAFKALVLGQ